MRKPSVLQIIRTTRNIAASFEMQFGLKRGRSLQMTGASCIAGAGAGMGKLIMGLFSLSLFTCVSALFSFAMAVAKVVGLSTLMREAGREEQARFCAMAGRLLVAASALYIAYNARFLWEPAERGFHLYIAIGIAAFTFFELALNIRGVLVERRNRAPLFYTLKTINLASACINLALTQRVLLALHEDSASMLSHARANMLMGLLMGSCALLLGVKLILRMKRMANGVEYADANRKLRRLARRAGMHVCWSPAWLRERDGMVRLGVFLSPQVQPETLASLRALARDMLQIELHPIFDADVPLKEERI